MLRQIGRSQQTASGPDAARQGFGGGTPVEGVPPAGGDGLEGARQLRLAERLAGLGAVTVEQFLEGGVRSQRRTDPVDGPAGLGREREPVAGVAHGRLEQLGERAGAEALPRRAQGVDETRHGHRHRPNLGIGEVAVPASRAAGTAPLPLRATTSPPGVRMSQKASPPTPPTPHHGNSTTPWTAAAQMAASTALPPPAEDIEGRAGGGRAAGRGDPARRPEGATRVVASALSGAHSTTATTSISTSISGFFR